MNIRLRTLIPLATVFFLVGCKGEDEASPSSGYTYNSCTIHCTSPAVWDGKCYNVEENTFDEAIEVCKREVIRKSLLLTFYNVTLSANPGTCD